MFRKKWIFYFLIKLFVSLYIFSNDYLNFEKTLNKYYESFLFKAKKSQQEFIIREEIKELEQNLFIINKNVIKDFEVIKNYKLPLREKEWNIEKLYFVSFGNMQILSPGPKLEREYYKKKVDFDESKYSHLLKIKNISFSNEIGEHILQFYPLSSKKINFKIEFFLFSNEIIDDILKKGYNNIIYKISFIHDISPLNTFDRNIKVYGIVEAIKWL